MLPEGWTARVSKPNIAEWFTRIKAERRESVPGGWKVNKDEMGLPHSEYRAVPSPKNQTAVECDGRELETDWVDFKPKISEGGKTKLEARPKPTDPMRDQDPDQACESPAK